MSSTTCIRHRKRNVRLQNSDIRNENSTAKSYDNPLTEAADTLLDLADTKAYEEQQRIIQRRKNENRINNILFIV